MKRLLSDYGMVFALLVLCLFYSVRTLRPQHPQGRKAARDLIPRVAATAAPAETILIVSSPHADGQAFAETLRAGLADTGLDGVDELLGTPADLRRRLESHQSAGRSLQIMATTRDVADWTLMDRIPDTFSALGDVLILTPEPSLWPDFLKRDNLLAIADRIVVIAIIAIGMTMVIITGGIDLSVGSLIAFSAVLSTTLMVAAGGESASAATVVACMLAAVVVCGLIGLGNGALVAWCGIAPFIATLAMMMVAKGLAFIVAGGESVYQLPASLVSLGRGAWIPGLPNTVLLLIILYAIAYVVMSRTVLGRHIYAVGGNAEAARLSGVPVRRVIALVYAVCAALAGLGGVIQASQLKSGAPTYGLMYELYVIAAVVVGGTSLSGGEGKILGTLIGAFIIAVIQNGMNLTGVESYTQQVVLGLVILGAVLLDKIKHHGGWRRFQRATGTT